MKRSKIDFRNFYLNLNFSRECVCGILGISRSTIYRWEREQKAPTCAIRALKALRSGQNIAELDGWNGWSVTEYGIVSPLGHCYFLDELEPPFRLIESS